MNIDNRMELSDEIGRKIMAIIEEYDVDNFENLMDFLDVILHSLSVVIALQLASAISPKAIHIVDQILFQAWKFVKDLVKNIHESMGKHEH